MPNLTSFLFVLVSSLGLIAGASAADTPAKLRVAFIIDDGPSPEQAAQLHAIFAKEKIHVSFAHVGKNVRAHPELSKAAAAAGHELINHSFTHAHFLQLDDQAIQQEVRDTSAAIQEVSGRPPAWYWAPYGDWDTRIEKAVRAAGLEHIPVPLLHFISTEDWNRETDAATIRRRATTDVRDKTLILFHEWREETLAEFPAIIAELKRQNCEFLTVSELVNAAKN